jgi:GT2 family glycosyltransferase
MSLIPAGKVAIVIATHKQCYPLDRCIEQHSALLSDQSDIIFIDNGSGGELTSWAEENFPGITLFTRKENGFFCAGYNAGMAYALAQGYEYILIVNADTDINNPNYLQSLLEAASKHPQGAFFGPRVFIRSTDQIQNTVLLFPWFSRYLREWLMGSFRSSNRSAEIEIPTEVEFLNGVCVLCRVSALQEIGLMDEVMGGYVEDTDWSWRALQLGWKSLFIPVSSIVHHQPTDEYEYYSLKSFMLRRNHIYWHKKGGRWVQGLGFAFSSLVLAIVRAIIATLRRQNSSTQHWYYLRRSFTAAFGIMVGREIGEWFGPPMGEF